MSIDAADEQRLHRALELARAGTGLASPNPHVGAVIVDAKGNVVGEGTYTYAGLKHAEILALEAAGPKARGGTLYINLEPHAHHGRTPPCTDALIGAGIRRVVASMPDPNPRVSGRGFDQLRAAGLEVEVGAIERAARRLNEAFSCYIRRGVSLVTLKSAMTLDGKIAPEPRSSERHREGEFSGHWITGESARAHVHKLRHEQDAILVGIGTVLADDPLLTDRSGRPRRRPLLRVILDSHLRLPLDSRLLKQAKREGNNDVLVFFCSANAERKSELERSGARVEKVPANAQGRIDLTEVLRCLAELEMTSLMIEGGSQINAAALGDNFVDKVFLYYAPKIFGGDAVPFAASNKAQTTNQPVELSDITLQRFGQDFGIEGYLRDPYG